MAALRPFKPRTFHGVHGNEVHHRIAPFKKFRQTRHFRFTVVHTSDQRPFNLRRILRFLGIGQRHFKHLFRGEFRRIGKKFPTFRVVRRVQRQSNRRADVALPQGVKQPFVPHGRNHNLLMRQPQRAAEEIYRFHHFPQVVTGFAHPHEHHFFQIRPNLAGLHDLRHNFRTS